MLFVAETRVLLTRDYPDVREDLVVLALSQLQVVEVLLRRGYRVAGFSFGGRVVDFLQPASVLAVELDGAAADADAFVEAAEEVLVADACFGDVVEVVLGQESRDGVEALDASSEPRLLFLEGLTVFFTNFLSEFSVLSAKAI